MVSCDCVQNVSGIITDMETGEPIANAKVYKKSKTHDESVTDSLGKFSIRSISGGVGCPPMDIVIEKEGYDKLEASIDAGGSAELQLVRK